MIAIAIDGPAGAGKSTLSKQLASELGFLYIDTGALYRTVGLSMIQKFGTAMTAEQIGSAIGDCKIHMAVQDGKQRIYLDGQEVSDNIRTPEASMAASTVSAHPAVRAFLLDLQRKTARENNVIMDGRDIGSVVLPDAQIKIFLTASPEDRAGRRFRELQQKGLKVNYEEVLRDVIQRDTQDETRAISPLKCADDAILLDTSGNSFEESYMQLKRLISNRMELLGL